MGLNIVNVDSVLT